MPKKREEEGMPSEADVLRRMLNTPPTPFTPKPKPKKAPKKRG